MRISDWSSDVCSSDLFCLLALPSTSPGNARRVSTKLEKGDAAGFGRNANPGRNRPGQPFAPADDRIVIAPLLRQHRQTLIIKARTRVKTGVIRAVAFNHGALQRPLDSERLLAWACEQRPHARSDERRGGKECGSTVRSLWTPGQ